MEPDPSLIKEFGSAQEWEQWLEKNYTNFEGVWLMIAKKGSGKTTVTYLEAVEASLCYGWIDGQVKTHSAEYYIQKFTPRRPRSMWSRINRGKAEELIASGKMKASGLKVIEEAKADGRWDKAYDSPGVMTVPDDFLEILKKNKKAESFYKTLNKTNLFAIGYRLQTAKTPEIRNKRIEQIIGMLAEGKKFH